MRRLLVPLSNRALAWLLATLVLCLTTLVAPAPTWAACRCTDAELPELVQRSSAVFVGSVTGAERDTAGRRYTVEVQRVFKGPRRSPVALRSPASRDRCGLALRPGRTYVVLGRVQGEVVEVNRCGGTASSTGPLLSQVRSVLGDGRSPTPSPAESPSASPTAATITRLEGAEPMDFGRLAAPGAAAVILGLLGLFVLGRLGRSR